MYNQEQEHQHHQNDDLNNNTINSNKEKLAAARKRLKQFKKNKENGSKNGERANSNSLHDNASMRSIESSSVHDHEITNVLGVNNNQHYFVLDSNRSSPSSKNSYGMTRSQINDLEKHQNDFIDIINKNTSNSPVLNANLNGNDMLTVHYYEQKYNTDIQMFQEQLQLHLQTIGILVAEKTELQSTLQQTMKKIDKKQEEIDELSGRLKASRQKISDLEKYINQTSDSNVKVEESTREYENMINSLKTQLNSSLLANDELKIRLNELTDKYSEKTNENKQLTQEVTDLRSQVEIAQLRIGQLNSAIINNEPKESIQTNEAKSVENEELIKSLNDKIVELEQTTNELKTDLDLSYKQKNDLKNEYEIYVSKFQSQIESLVDQINKMTDEREEAFEKIEVTEKRMKELKTENDRLLELNNKAHIDSQAGLNDIKAKMLMDERRQQLECEVQYFKQQIEILLLENNHLNGMIVEKDNTIEHMKKMHLQINDEKKNYENLLEAMQSEKVALSRAIQQNKELKEQLSELEAAYIKLTNTNADLLNKVQAEQHLNKQLNLTIHARNEEINSLKLQEAKIQETKLQNAIEVIEKSTASNEETKVNQDWDADDDANNASTNNNANSDVTKVIADTNSTVPQQDFNKFVEELNAKDLLINNLNIELKDLKDKINTEILEKVNLANALAHNNELKLKEEINSLNIKIQDLEFERKKLLEVNEKLNVMNSVSNGDVDNSNQANDDETATYTQKNIKLLEYKFTKVMQDNVDLREKNQQLEHIVTQLQFESDTIVDYISMYQVEREKLTQKYRLKDETIRKLNTQIQMNKFAIKQLYNLINEFYNIYVKNQNSVNNSLDNEQSNYLVSNLTSAFGLGNENTGNSLTASLTEFKNASQETDSKERDNLITQINQIISQINENNKEHIDHDSNSTNIDDNNDNKLGNLNNTKIVPLRSIIICSSCQGDLFNV